MTTAAIIGALSFVVLLILIFNGVPVFVSLLSTAFCGLLILNGGDITLVYAQLTKTPFTVSASFDYAVVPMFILVGTLASLTGIAEGAFRAMHAWLGRIKGGTLFTVIGADAVFGACSGVSSAANIVFSRLALPELRTQGYDERYALGCITAAGALSALIPPSMGILIFCLVTPSPVAFNGMNVTVSVGTALTCGILPGIVVALLLCGTVRLVGFIHKDSVPEASKEKIPMREKLISLKLLIPILCLFALIIGGCMLGWFSATVGGAIAAMACCIYAVAKRIPIKQVLASIWEAATMEGSIFAIIMAGQVFSRFIAQTRLASFLSELLLGLQAPAFVVFMIITLFYLGAGCIMNMVPLIIITAPVVFPVLCALGYSPYAVIISLVFMVEIAGMTPPIGMGVYMVSNAVQMDSAKIFRGCVPFFLTEYAVVVLIGIFPDLITWLPSALGMISWA